MLQSVHDRTHLRPGNALKVVAKTAKNLGETFDLILAGGLFDYLPDKQAAYLIEHAYALLKAGGSFFFTNIERGNPYRPLIEYFGDWFLIERTEEDIVHICGAAGIAPERVSVARDETGLTLLIEIDKP